MVCGVFGGVRWCEVGIYVIIQSGYGNVTILNFICRQGRDSRDDSTLGQII